MPKDTRSFSVKQTARMLLLTPFVTLALLLLAFASPLSVNASVAPLHTAHFQTHVVVKHAQARQPLARHNLTYHGGPGQAGTANIFAIFWEPTGNVSARYNSLLQQFFGDIGSTGLYHNNTQYTQTGGGAPSNAHLAGTFVDTIAYPESPLLDSDIQNEVRRRVSTAGPRRSITYSSSSCKGIRTCASTARSHSAQAMYFVPITAHLARTRSMPRCPMLRALAAVRQVRPNRTTTTLT